MKKNKRNLSAKKKILEKSLYKEKHFKESIETVKYWNRFCKINPYFTRHGFNGVGIERMLTFFDRQYNVKRKFYREIKLKIFKRYIKTYSRLMLDGIIDPPLNGKKVGIRDFFKGAYNSKINYFKIIKNEKKLEKFKRVRGNRRQYQIVEDKLKTAYKHYVLNNKRVRYTATQERQFKLASKRLVRYMIGERQLDFLDPKKGASIDDFIRILFTALRKYYKKFKDPTFGIGNLCSNYTFNEILPKYINFNKPE